MSLSFFPIEPEFIYMHRCTQKKVAVKHDNLVCLLILFNRRIGRNKVSPFAPADLLEYLIRLWVVKIEAALMLGVHKNTQSCKNRENKIRQELTEDGIPNHKRSKTAIEEEAPNAVTCDLYTHCFKLLLSEVFLETNKIFNLVRVVVAVAFNVVVKASATLDGKSVCADRNALSFWKSINYHHE